jgi:hypothetical protein
MMNALAMLYGITAVAFVVAFVDWLARRRDRQKREGRT